MYIKGEFRDVLKRKGEVIEDRGWKSNTIVPDFGNFLAAVMKKDFKDPLPSSNPVSVGIEYIAVGSSSGNDPGVFKDRVKKFFEGLTPLPPTLPIDPEKPLPLPENNWVWVKKIEDNNIKYIKDNDAEADEDEITNRIEIDVTFEENEPLTTGALELQDFSLLGIYKSGTRFDTKKMFFINHVSHGVITKEAKMTLTRTIRLKFPIV